MFWKKKAPIATGDQIIAQMITQAYGSGDQRTELTCRLLQVAQEAEKIRVSMQSIVDNYSDRLSELTHDACHLFPTPLAVQIENLERTVSNIFEEVEGFADASQDLLIKLNRYTKK